MIITKIIIIELIIIKVVVITNNILPNCHKERWEIFGEKNSTNKAITTIIVR